MPWLPQKRKQQIFMDGVVFGLIAVLVFLVFRQTYVPGTWFMGWDSVMSEFNLGLAWRRALAGVWQEFQGLGLQGGHGYVTDLVRLPLLWLLSVFMPDNMIRYVYAFLMWFVGGAGVYILSWSLLCRWRLTQMSVTFLALAGGVLYLFHPYTIQMFYVMHDAFAWFYAILPWWLWSWGRLIDKPNRNRIIFWLGLSFFSSFSGFIPPVFVAMILVLAILSVGAMFGNGDKKTMAVAFGLFVMSQLYWLLPFGYYTLTQRDDYLQSKLNQLTTPENRLKSEQYGTIRSLMWGEGFYFDSLDISFVENKTVPVFRAWMDWWGRDDVRIILSVLFGLMVMGWVGLLKPHDNRVWKGFPFAAVTVFGFMAVGSQPFAWIMDWLYEIPVFGQAFRIPFTKLSSLYVLFFSLLAILGIGLFIQRFSKQVLQTLIAVSLTVAMIGSIAWVVKPVFEGQFLYWRSKTEIPQAYFDLMDYFKSQPKEARIAVLPIHSYNGWYIQDWGYTGSGFWFYGVEQPVMDRTFDVWSKENETYYQQMARAIYLKDVARFQELLTTYGVEFVVVDESVSSFSGDKVQLNIDGIEYLLAQVGAEHVFGNNYLSIYTLGGDEKFVWSPDEYDYVEVEDYYSRDRVLNGITRIGSGRLSGALHPFSGLSKENLDQLYYENNELRVVHQLGIGGILKVPGMEKGKNVSLSGRVSLIGDVVRVEFEPFMTFLVDENVVSELVLTPIELQLKEAMPQVLVSVNGVVAEVKQNQLATIAIAAITGEAFSVRVYGGGAEVMETRLERAPLSKCWVRPGYEGTIFDELSSGIRRVTVADASACMTMRLGGVSLEKGLMQVNQVYRSENNAKPHFCVDVEGGEYRCEHEDVFFQSPASAEWSTITRYVEVGKGNTYWLDVIARPSDKVGQTWTLEYENPRVAVYPLLAEKVMMNELWQTVLYGQEVVIPEGAHLIASWKAKPVEVDFSLAGNVEVQNCDLFKRGVVEKLDASRFTLHANNTTTYRAKDRGAACDLVSLPHLSFNQEYVLRWQGQNISGRSLKFYLFNNHSQRNDLEVLLNPKRFDQSFGVLSWPGFDEKGYLLSLENRSFGREVSENRIENVAFYPAPLSWLSQVQVRPEGFTIDDLRFKNNLTILEVKKYGTGHYVVKTEGEGLLALNQGYEKGWRAVPMTNFQFLIFNFQIPNFFKPFEHVKVNGWSNGWVVEEVSGCKLQASQEMEREACSMQLLIFYWPQYLQWLGLGMFPFMFILIFGAGRRRRERH